MPPAIGYAAALIWTGICAADQRALGGRQLHQPIVAAVGIGLILGDPERALFIGLWMQLVWSTPMPVGGRLLPDTGSAAASAAIVSVLLPGWPGLAAALLLGLLIARLTISWEYSLRRHNGKRERDAISGGNAIGLRAILLGVAGPFLRGMIFAALAIGAGLLMNRVAGSAESWPIAETGMVVEAMIGGAICVGLAALLLRFRTEIGRSGLAYIVGGILAGAAVRFILLAGSR